MVKGKKRFPAIVLDMDQLEEQTTMGCSFLIVTSFVIIKTRK